MHCRAEGNFDCWCSWQWLKGTLKNLVFGKVWCFFGVKLYERILVWKSFLIIFIILCNEILKKQRKNLVIISNHNISVIEEGSLLYQLSLDVLFWSESFTGMTLITSYSTQLMNFPVLCLYYICFFCFVKCWKSDTLRLWIVSYKYGIQYCFLVFLSCHN